MQIVCRLQVVSNFGDSDSGVGENTQARAKFRGDATRGERRKLREISRARVCVFLPAPRSLSPKLETTRSLNCL